jgi:hypothetical protein
VPCRPLGPSACRAGFTACATMAACCSSTCAITTASPRSSPTRIRRLQHRRDRCAANGSSASMARSRRDAEDRQPNLPTGEIEVFATEIEVLSEGPRTAAAGLRRARTIPEDIRLKYRFLDLRRERCTPTSCCAPDHRRMRELMTGRLHRVPDADPDGLVAGRRARLPGAEPHPSGQVLRAAAGAAAVQAAADDVGLRPLLPDRAVLPRRRPARRPLPGEFYQLDLEMSFVEQDDVFWGDGAGHPRRVRGICRRQAGDRRNSRAFPMTRRCANTVPTSRTCATRSRCRT